MTNILIVDGQDDIGAGICSMLLLDPTFVVVSDLSDGAQVPAFLRENAVNLALMNIRTADIDGSATTRSQRRCRCRRSRSERGCTRETADFLLSPIRDDRKRWTLTRRSLATLGSSL